MNYFDGDWFTFFSDVYGKDRDVIDAMSAIKPGPAWLRDIRCVVSTKSDRELRRIAAMTEEGNILLLAFGVTGDWGDYRYHLHDANGFLGGAVTGEELRDYVKAVKSISPRIKVALYSIMVSTNPHTPLYKEHPDWTRRLDRRGNDNILFPGCASNYALMINKPDCFNVMRDQLFEMSRHLGCDYVYLDEAKTTNLINWQTGELIRDDHCYNLWREMNKRAAETGLPLFFNSRGESIRRHQLH